MRNTARDAADSQGIVAAIDFSARIAIKKLLMRLKINAINVREGCRIVDARSAGPKLYALIVLMSLIRVSVVPNC